MSVLLSLLFAFLAFALPIRLYIEKRAASLVISSVEISARAQITEKIGDTVTTLLSKDEYSGMLSSPVPGQNEVKVNGTLLSLFVSELNLILSKSLSSLTLRTKIPLGKPWRKSPYNAVGFHFTVIGKTALSHDPRRTREYHFIEKVSIERRQLHRHTTAKRMSNDMGVFYL